MRPRTHWVGTEALMSDRLDQGLSAKDSTSQLILLTDQEYAAGVDRIRTDIVERERQGLALRLTGNLTIHATAARVPG